MFQTKLDDEIDNFFSIYKGAKFVIPFFDDTYNNKIFIKNSPLPNGQGGIGIGEDWNIVKTMDRITEDAINCLDKKYIGYGKRVHIYNGKKKLMENYGIII